MCLMKTVGGMTKVVLTYFIEHIFWDSLLQRF